MKLAAFLLFSLTAFLSYVNAADNGKSTAPIAHRGGPVMTKPETTLNRVKFFLENLGHSEWYGVTRAYHNGKTGSQKEYVSGQTTLKAVWKVSDKEVKNFDQPEPVLEQLWKKHNETPDPDTLYIMIIAKKGPMFFCQKYCGFHRKILRPGKEAIKFAVVVDTTQCPGVPNQSKGCLQKPIRDVPTNTWDALDMSSYGMVNIIAHEISEAVTDPISPTGWTDGRKRSYENGDKCNQKFGSASDIKFDKKIVHGKQVPLAYNTEIRDRRGHVEKFLIQQMWHPEKQMCTLKR